ncbi:hypothetical protein EI014_23360 [Escherichia coli]|nr:hypothetical protein [Escherichia coli]MQJ83809.1 hypothetical protein [Escherichia coli]MXD31126.1 hypothetical protein [Escherichia coli]
MPENPASYRVVRTKSYLFNKADLFTKKAMNWRKTICPEGLSVPLLLPDCNNRYYSKYCLFHLRSCF